MKTSGAASLAVAKPSMMRKDAYKQTGVDTDEADAGLFSIVRRIQATWPEQGDGRVLLPVGPDGYFANVIEVGGNGIALCTDGVGSKSLVATMLEKYDTIGIDCVAMNVNDMICVGAKPISMVDYLAVERADASMLDEIGVGLVRGATLAGISISGGETAQLKNIVHGFDLVGMAMGQVQLNRVLSGEHVVPGDIVIGVKSSGVHSNGLTLARKAFFEGEKFRVSHKFDDLELSIGEELLRPTDIYVAEAMEILARVAGTKALINVTSDGLLNLTRVAAKVGFVIDSLPDPHPIFRLIQKYAEVPEDSEMFEVFNMGIGFCYVVEPAAVELTLSILKDHGRVAQPIGHVINDPSKTVHILEWGLEGRHKRFWTTGKVIRQAG